ncbi:hypothetical protein ABPG74_000781, partial [Tetrahymena malaccensis]
MKRLSILMIIFIIRCSHSFNFIKIPQVQVDQLNFVTPEFLKAGQRLASQSINHNVSFTSTPQILLAVERLSFDSGDLNFKATVSSSNSTQFNLTIQRYSDKISYFFNITIRYLAINMKDCFVKTGDLSFQENKYDCDLNMMCEKQTFMYQKSNFDSQKWNVTVGFYFIGIEQVQLQNNNISLSLLNEIVYNSNSFDIIVKTRDKNHYNQINKIYYNYIEIYKQIDNSYYHFSNINNSINPRQNQSNYQAFYPPDYQINIDKLAGIFYGIIEIELTYFNQIGVTGCILLIVNFVYIILAFIIQSLVLFKLNVNQKRFNQYEPQIQDILQIQLANGSILQKTRSRMYMIAFLVFENILFPLVVISFKSSYVGQMSSLITIQTLEFIITLYIRPFQNNLVNISFIFEQ